MGKTFIQALNSYMSQSGYFCGFMSDFRNKTYDIKNNSELLSGLLNNGSEPLGQLCSNACVHPADRDMVSAFCRDLLDSAMQPVKDDSLSISFRGNVSRSDDADYRWMIINIIVQADENNNMSSILGFIHIMSGTELINKSIIDSFTNDKHPKAFEKLINDILESGVNIAYIQFDIENFKLINSKYGEEVGTEILEYIKNGLDVLCTAEQVHFRLSADVFMIVMSYSDREEAETLIASIRDRLSHYGDIEYKLVFGVNFVENYDKSVPSRVMGDRAAMARRAIKGNALKSVGYYAEKQENLLELRKTIEDRMYYALEHNEFVMYLQPKYSISANSIVGAEALVRWIHPEKGLIPPMDFIPLFERNGFIIKLDEYIWEQACQTVRKWIDSGREPFPISINISRAHLDGDDFINTLNRLIEKYGISKKYIEAEITETIENGRTEEAIKNLKNSGFTLLMDDFGSGYSSLNMLKSTPFDVIKMDRVFFSEFMLSERGKKIIAHTISMSKDIGLDLVAEGVETKEQADFLYKCGCNIAQGFFYSRPVKLEDFERMAFPD